MKTRPKDMLPATIFIPVYNEEDILFKNIERLVAYLSRHFPLYEIMIGSNGSTDSTIKIGEKLQNSYQEVTFFHISEKGVGRAFKKGVALAAWDRIITVDVDLKPTLILSRERADCWMITISLSGPRKQVFKKDLP